MCHQRVLFCLILATILGLSGCGQKGPLYLPDEDLKSRKSDKK